jgi:Putative MetA-pathway of phenol degradation
MGWAMLCRAAFTCCVAAIAACAQDLVPRAYVIAPIGANAITLSTSYFDGPVSTDPSIPITDFTARFAVSALSYSRSLNFFGRSSNVVGTIPYGVGHFRGTVTGVEAHAYRSGLVDSRLRFSVNLRGGPAMRLRDFARWREKFVIGTSFTVIVPTGQYDPVRLINLGLNRWGFKPELGVSRRWGPWALDVYGGIWFFTGNDRFFPGTSTRTQAPVGSTEMHFSYTVKPRFWASFDGNFWTDGQSAVNGVSKHDFARNSRVGATVSVPINRHQSLKFSFSDGAYIAVGGNYKNVSAAWQYSWLSAEK